VIDELASPRCLRTIDLLVEHDKISAALWTKCLFCYHDFPSDTRFATSWLAFAHETSHFECMPCPATLFIVSMPYLDVSNIWLCQL
jgi:hypothetical protein